MLSPSSAALKSDWSALPGAMSPSPVGVRCLVTDIAGEVDRREVLEGRMELGENFTMSAGRAISGRWGSVSSDYIDTYLTILAISLALVAV